MTTCFSQQHNKTSPTQKHSAMNFHPPSPREAMLAFWRSTCDNQKLSLACQFQVSHKGTKIVLEGRWVHVRNNYDKMYRTVVFVSLS